MVQIFDDCTVDHRSAFTIFKGVKGKRATFTRSDDLDTLTGMLLEYMDSGDPLETKKFEFEVEYKSGSWYPLRDGYLPASDEQTERPLLGKRLHWSALPKTTPIGWRGPMVLWENLENAPMLFHVSGAVTFHDFE